MSSSDLLKHWDDTYQFINEAKYVYVCVYVYVGPCVCTHMHMRVRACVLLCVHMCIHVHVYIVKSTLLYAHQSIDHQSTKVLNFATT